MIRTVVYLLVAIFLITLLRYVIGMILKAFGELFQPQGSVRGPRTQAAGELKKDPVCGTFVAPGTSVKETVHGEAVYFCSTACRDKFRVNSSRSGAESAPPGH